MRKCKDVRTQIRLYPENLGFRPDRKLPLEAYPIGYRVFTVHISIVLVHTSLLIPILPAEDTSVVLNKNWVFSGGFSLHHRRSTLPCHKVNAHIWPFRTSNPKKRPVLSVPHSSLYRYPRAFFPNRKLKSTMKSYTVYCSRL